MARTRRKKKRTHVVQQADPSKKGPPKSFVFGRGQFTASLKNLEADLRRVMQPHTATHLKESKRNQLKDFVDLAGPLGVSDFLILTATEHASYLKLAKTPRGPTLTMQIHSYSLISDVAASQRVILLNYSEETNLINFRQYGVTATPSGVSKSVKVLVGKRQIPDLSKFEDVADFLTKSGYGSESEGEDAADSRVTLAQDMGRGNLAARQSRIRLQEHITRSPTEVEAQTAQIKSREDLRDKRRKEQEENVKRKEARKRKAESQRPDNNSKQKTAKKRKQQWWEAPANTQADEAPDDDALYYRQEV